MKARSLTYGGKLVLNQKGLAWAESCPSFASDVPALGKHLMQKYATPLVRIALADSAASKSELVEPILDSSVPLKKAFETLPKDNQEDLKLIMEAHNNAKSLHDFVSSLEDLSSSGAVRFCFRPFGKKAERDLFAQHKDALRQRVRQGVVNNDDVQGIGALFADLCSLLVAERHRAILEFPGKLAAAVVSALHAATSTPLLVTVHREIVETIKSGAVTTETEANLEELRRMVLKEAGEEA